MSASAIEWTDATWNPVTGCDRVSPGCAHCYALDLAARLKRMGQARYQRDGDPKTSGPGFGVTLHPDKLEEPLRWRKPRMVFVNSMSDLFHEEIPADYIAAVFAVMAYAERHTFQVLTKRPKRMRRLLSDDRFWLTVRVLAARGIGGWRFGVPHARPTEPLPNVWLGVSIENRRFVERARILGETPAAIRFVSAEPLLGPLIPQSITSGETVTYEWKDDYAGPGLPFYSVDAELNFDWLIAGGESGPQHRPMDLEWARDLRDVCTHEGVAYFFKQVGGRTPKAGGRELDGRTWDEMPELHR